MTRKWSCGKWGTLAKTDVTNSAKIVASVEKPSKSTVIANQKSRFR